MVKEVDPNNDGKISLEEFQSLMKGEEVDFKSWKYKNILLSLPAIFT